MTGTNCRQTAGRASSTSFSDVIYNKEIFNMAFLLNKSGNVLHDLHMTHWNQAERYNYICKQLCDIGMQPYTEKFIELLNHL